MAQAARSCLQQQIDSGVDMSTPPLRERQEWFPVSMPILLKPRNMYVAKSAGGKMTIDMELIYELQYEE